MRILASSPRIKSSMSDGKESSSKKLTDKHVDELIYKSNVHVTDKHGF
jgi:hypothetical protein